MKRSIISALTVLTILVLPTATAMALTMPSGRAALTPSTCLNLTRNLTVGSVGPDVLALKNFLKTNNEYGSTYGNVYNSTFDVPTRRAVAAWQVSVGIVPAGGYVGPVTRAALSSATCGGTTTSTDLNVIVDPSSPGSRIVPINNSNGIQGIQLLAFDVIPNVPNLTIKSIEVYSTGSALPILLQLYSNQSNFAVASSTSSTNKFLFSNFNISGLGSSTKVFSLTADYQPGIVNGSFSNVLVSAVTYTKLTGEVKTIYPNIQSATTTFAQSGLSVSNESAITGGCLNVVVSNASSTVKCDMRMSFTLTNGGNSDIFVSKNPQIAIIGSSTPNTASTSLQFINIASSAGDTMNAYDVTSGSSRTFTYSGTMSAPAGGGFETYKIIAINYGASSMVPNSSAITAGLEPLFVSMTIGNPTLPKTADVNGDGKINSADISFMNTFIDIVKGDPDYKVSLDFNNDGKVDSTDAALFRAAYNAATQNGTASSTPAVRGASTQCISLTQALQKGTTDAYSNGEVTLLQQFLQTQGYPFADFGKFGPMTDTALKQWQAKQGISATGITGTLTRAQIETISCK